MGIADERYVALTTYRRSGATVTTPVWVVPVSDGRLGHVTAMGSGKTQRLRRDPRVTVQPANGRGATRSATSARAGTAEMVRSGRLFDEVRREVRRKYGIQDRVAGLLSRLRLGPVGSKGLTYADTVVLVRLDDQANSA
ncbi:PPOX class F420-dependent oxidoreductase [Nocardioides sp.]|jgi:PPOX class probable F420-dependent enzyme|uniref:PPOX class F420-dependent oxidoreductase n=1 Tax=Nocardioides sp. TaxID=35761 RepID=UPI0031FE778A|nr:hypothetical protein [Nocardioides sp.]